MLESAKELSLAYLLDIESIPFKERNLQWSWYQDIPYLIINPISVERVFLLRYLDAVFNYLASLSKCLATQLGWTH